MKQKCSSFLTGWELLCCICRDLRSQKVYKVQYEAELAYIIEKFTYARALRCVLKPAPSPPTHRHFGTPGYEVLVTGTPQPSQGIL